MSGFSGSLDALTSTPRLPARPAAAEAVDRVREAWWNLRPLSLWLDENVGASD